MTREEAIKVLKEIEYPVNGDNKEYRDMAFAMAISALSESKGDLISRQAVKDIILGGVSTDTDVDKEYVCGLIDNLPSVENKGEWIPVSKRLPEIGHVVYCQLTDGSHEILFMDDFDGQMTWRGRWRSNYNVIAWREMPEPYKEGE